MRCIVVLFLLIPTPGINMMGADLYPDVRAIIHEAELTAPKTHANDGRNLQSWAASLYARAGYLDDAARALSHSPDPPYTLFRARILYGDLAGAEKSVDQVADPRKRVTLMISIADLLWRMGNAEEARVHLESAKTIAAQIANPEHRKLAQSSIQQSLSYLGEEPPDRFSTIPKPIRKFQVQDSAIPLFPITTDGFRSRDPNDVTERARGDAEFLTKLYGRIEARDEKGLLRVFESAQTIAQKQLALASAEHLFILVGDPVTAERYARAMPQIDSDRTLSTAEALSAAAAAWLRAGDCSRAVVDFAAAVLVESVPDLPDGRVSVLISISMAQAKGGLGAASVASLKLAQQIAQAVPVRPMLKRGQPRTYKATDDFRDREYERIFAAAIRNHDLESASETAELWRGLAGISPLDIMRAWFDAGRPHEALALARALRDPKQRATALLDVAERLLKQAGAPYI